MLSMSARNFSLYLCMFFALVAMLSQNVLGFRATMPMLSSKLSIMNSASSSLTSSSSRSMSGQRKSSLQMNILQDAFRFFTNLNKEASAKHILKTGPNANEQLTILKQELQGLSGEELSTAFSEIAAKVSECPSAKRGGNLGTFKPGMMVREFDQVCFEKELGVVHGPVQTQFGSHLILITRRYEGEKK